MATVRSHLGTTAQVANLALGGIFLIGGTRLYRDALAQALHARHGVLVAGAAATVDAAALFLADLIPAVILLHASAATASADPGVLAVLPGRVVVLGERDVDAVAWIEAGAGGYVRAEASVDELVSVLEAAMRGELVCSPRVAAALAERLQELARARRPSASALLLTAREREIVALIDRGLSDKEIAARLVISSRTVKNHVHTILRKLQVTNRVQAAALVRGGPLPHAQDLVPAAPETSL